MKSHDPSSDCFAVSLLRRTLVGKQRGCVKDFVVEKHLDNFRINKRTRRNFTFWWRWSHTNGLKRWKMIKGAECKRKGMRVDDMIRSPLEQRSVHIARLAVMIKCRRWTTASMEGLNADHNRGPDGWQVADWRLLRVIDADADPDRGWYSGGI